MNGHPFDSFAQWLARPVGRRKVLRTLATLTAGVAAHAVLPPRVMAWRSQQGPLEPQPPPFWPPDVPLDPPGDVIDDYTDCLAPGYTEEECNPSIPWCEVLAAVRNRAFPNVTGILETLGPFGEDCGTTDCLQCCYVPNTNQCHSSYIGEDVINCNPRTYGAGTRGVGLTLLLQEPPPDGTCLFTPQICAHIGMCQQESVFSVGTVGGKAGTFAQDGETDYLTDPRAIKQRARVFAMYAQTQVRHYLAEYATDSPDALPLQSLNDALLGRGWATWRQDMATLRFDLADPLFRVTDSAGNVIESASRANVGRLFALMRLLTGLPNLPARLEYVESRVWSAADKQTYLAAIPDPDLELQASLDPHIVNILKRVPMLQDYQLLAVPLAGEVASAGHYGGMPLGQPPTMRLSTATDRLSATLTATLDDPSGDAGLALPLSVDWGDGHVTRHEIPVTQATLAVSHTYAAASRYAIYAVAANASGLRGAACVVVEVQDAEAGARRVVPAQATSPTLVRAGLRDLSILNLAFQKDFRLALSFTDAAGLRFRAGRSRIASGPTDITETVDIGDAYAHNPSRLEILRLAIEPRHAMVGPSARRIPKLTLGTLLLGVFSTAQMRIVDVALALRVEMLDILLQDSPTPLPDSALTVNDDGSITVPMLYQETTTAPWQRVERIEIAITPDMFDDFVLDATPTELAVGTTASWTEVRPGSFTPVSGANSERVYLPLIRK